MRLVNAITPDHGTIAGFVKENGKAFHNTLQQLTLILKGWGLIDGKLIAIDGTKIRTQNNKHNCITQSGLDKKIAYADEKINSYLMAKNTKELLDIKEYTVIADIGYYNAAEIKNCIEDGMTVYIEKAKANNSTKDNEFRKEKLTYNSDDDTYICLSGERLVFFGNSSAMRRFRVVHHPKTEGLSNGGSTKIFLLMSVN